MKIQDVLQALKNADAAGDTEAATQLAQLAVRLRPDLAPAAPAPTPAQNTSGLGDIATAFKSGALGSTKALTDFAGAENVASRALGAKSEAVQAQYSPARQAEMQAQAARMKQAEDSGSVFDEIKAGVRSIAEAPLQAMAQGVGSFVPYIPAMLLGPVGAVLGLGAKTVAALGTVANTAPRIMGTAQGIGAVKGSIYDTVYEKERESGVPEADARAKALGAQEYTSKNIDQMALAGLLGYVAGSSGVERLLTPKGVAAAAPGMANRIGRTASTEFLTEASQGGQERLASNLALQREGYEVPTFQGVAGQATQEGLTGALAAGPIGAVRGPSAQPPPADAGAPTDIEAATQARRLQLQDEQRLALQGVSSREGEKILDAEAQEAAVLAKEQEARAQVAMQGEYTRLRTEREAELKEAFPADYSDVMERTNRYGVLATELASLEPVRKTAEVRGRIQTIQQRMADIAAEDDRIPNEMLRMQGAQIAAARAAGFPAEKAAQVFAGNAPAQMEMREVLSEGTLPPQTDLFGNPVQPTAPQTEGLQDVISAGLPATTDVLDAAGLAPTRRELEAAGQQRLGLRKTPAGQPTSPIRAAAPVPATAISPLPVVESAPADLAQPDAITAENVRTFDVMSKANRQWLVDNVQGRTPQQVRDMLEADPTIMTSVPKGLRDVLNEIVQVAAQGDAANVQSTSAVSTPTEPTIGGRGGKPGVGVPSELAPPGTVEPGAIAAPSTGELAPADGRGLVPTGQPVSAGNALEVDGQPALDEAQRKADAAEVAAALAEVDKSDRARRAPSTTATFDQPTKATPKPAPEVEQATGSPFAILNRIAARQAEAKATSETKSPKNKGRGSAAVAEGQSLDSLKTEIAEGKGLLASALRRAIASGNVVLETRHPDGGIGGYFDGTRVTLYADGIPAGQAMAVALHEVGAHMGFKRLFGERVYNNTIKRIQEIAAGKAKSQDRDIAQRALSRIPPEDIARGEEVYGDETLAYFIEEVLLAQQAGTLPNTGAVRSLLNNIRLAMLAAVNRVFGSKLGVADFTSNDILSMAQGAFLRESFGATKPGEAAPSDAGRTSKTQEITDILGDMGRVLPEEDTRPLITRAAEAFRKGAPKNNGVGMIQRVADMAADQLDAGEPLMREIRKAVRESLPPTEATETLVALSYSQASHDGGMATAALDDGGITFDNDLSKFKTEVSEFNRNAIHAVYKQMAKDYGMALPKVRSATSTALESKRMLALYAMQDTMLANAEILKASGSTAAAAKMQEKAEGYLLHMTRAEAQNGMKLFTAMPEINEIERLKEGMRGWLRKHLQDTGIWSEETGQWMLDNIEWVPFNREAAEVDQEAGGFTAYIRGLQVQAKDPKFKGSMREVRDVMDNFENWADYSVRRGVLNKKAADLATAALEYLPESEVVAVKTPMKNAADRTVLYMVNGEPQYVEFASASKAQIFKGAPAMARSALPVIGGLVDGLNSVFRGAILNFPLFPIYQLAMDSMSAVYISGLSPKYAYKIPILAVKEALATLAGASETHKKLRSVGAVGVHDYNATLAEANSDVIDRMRSLSGFEKYVALMHRMNLVADNAVRQSVYLMAIDSGLSDASAVEKAFEVINFRTRVGNNALAGAARNVVFLNSFYAASRAALKVLSNEGISPTERAQARKTLLSNMAWLGGLSFVMALANIGDEDYEKMSRREQAGKLTLPGLGGWGIPLRPDVFMLVKMMAETTARQGFSEFADDPAKAKATVSDAVWEALLSGPMPVAQPLKVAVEVATNHSFFTGRSLVGSGLEKRDAFQQFSSTTSELAKGIGASAKNLVALTGLEAEGISPLKIDHVIQGMLGMYGGALILATNSMVNSRPTQSAQDIIASLPGMARVGVKEFDSQIKSDFYALLKTVDKAVDTANRYKRDGLREEYQAYTAEKKDLLKYSSTVNRIERQLSTLRRGKEIAAASKTLTPEQRDAKIRELRISEEQMMKNLAPLIKKMRIEALS